MQTSFRYQKLCGFLKSFGGRSAARFIACVDKQGGTQDQTGPRLMKGEPLQVTICPESGVQMAVGWFVTEAGLDLVLLYAEFPCPNFIRTN